MIINLKNKHTLNVGNFKLKCCIGKNGLKKNRHEGDGTTPIGTFELGKVYWRPDRVNKPQTKLILKKIHKNMGWCTDIRSKNYNKEIKISNKIYHEKLFRKDFKYNYFILLKYNYKKVVKGKGSAIFIHLTKDYKSTEGCIALAKKDFLILLKIINRKTFIKIS